MPVFCGGNQVVLLHSGAEYFPALIAACDAATRDISVETYIFADDSTGQAIIDALARAAGRGVSVRLLLDGFGARDFRDDWRQRLIAAGASVLFFRRELTRFGFQVSRLRRLHRKIALFDGKTAFLGGINIIDDLTDVPGTHPRFDLAVRVEGPLMEEIYGHVQRLWRHVAWVHLRKRVREFTFLSTVATPGSMQAAFVLRDNIRYRRDIENAYLDAVRKARREVIIACAYFLPGRRFRHELANAAQRGVRVVLLLQGHTDHPWLQRATRAFYEYMLDRGVEIYEYSRSELHAKAAVVDGRWATVGSSNLDPFSLVMAREANIVVRDEAFAATLQRSLENVMANGSDPVRRILWKHRPLWQRASIWVGYGFARLAMGLLGLRGY